MIIASRRLTLRQSQTDYVVPVAIHAPVEADRCWDCRVEIGWPEGATEITVRAFDSVQALYLAMQRVAFELYVSPHHEAGNLRWDKPGDGYGFPIAKSGYGDLIGFDRETQVP